MKLLAAALFVSALAVPSSALAQKKIPKAQGHNQCPLGYVNTLGTTCTSPIYYEMRPTNGEACPSGWGKRGLSANQTAALSAELKPPPH